MKEEYAIGIDIYGNQHKFVLSKYIDAAYNKINNNLICNGKNLISLDLSNCTSVTIINCSFNIIESLDLSKCLILQRLYVQYNNLIHLDCSMSDELKILNCSFNYIDNLHLPKSRKKLEILSVQNNNNLKEGFFQRYGKYKKLRYLTINKDSININKVNKITNCVLHI